MLGSFLVACTVAVGYVVPPQELGTPQPPPLHPLEARIIEKTNSERAQHGLPPLAVDPKLVASARAHAAWMTVHRSLNHTTKPVGENIAMGQSSSHEVLNAWMNSSGHRANILHPGYSRIGVAAYTTSDGTIYWCQQFLH